MRLLVLAAAVPQDKRGKVFALMGMITEGLTPVAFALAGALAEFLPVAPPMSASFGAAILFGVPVISMGSLRRFISFDPEKDTVASVS